MCHKSAEIPDGIEKPAMHTLQNLNKSQTNAAKKVQHLNKGRHPFKKVANFRALPESGGGGLPMPKFFGPFFTKLKSLKLVHFC